MRDREVPLRAPRRFYRRPRARPSVTAGRVTEPNAPGPFRTGNGGSWEGGPGRGVPGRGTAWHRGDGDGAGQRRWRGAIKRRRKEPPRILAVQALASAPRCPPCPAAPCGSGPWRLLEMWDTLGLGLCSPQRLALGH